MFRDEKEVANESTLSRHISHRATIVDVDDTLILGKDENANAIDIFNHPLIEALVKAGIKEIYLLTAMKLNFQYTPEAREELKQKMRLDLINHLEQKGIRVIMVVTNNDLVHGLNQPSEAEEKGINLDLLLKTQIPGEYYQTVIRTFEQLLKDNPKLDLTTHEEFQQAIQRQAAHSVKIADLIRNNNKENVKEVLADLLFKTLKKQYDKQNLPMPKFQFLDDKSAFLESVARAAILNNVDLICLKVTPSLTMQDYLEFFCPYVCYENKIASLSALLVKQKEDVTKRLKGFISSSVYTGDLLSPLNKILEVLEKIQKDILASGNKHDCTGACNAIVHEMVKQENELRNLANKFESGKFDNERSLCARTAELLSTNVIEISKISVTLNEMFKHDTREHVATLS